MERHLTFIFLRDTPRIRIGLDRAGAPRGRVAEWSCRGLQIPVQRFDSALGLHRALCSVFVGQDRQGTDENRPWQTPTGLLHTPDLTLRTYSQVAQR